jgi:hypothetical protein
VKLAKPEARRVAVAPGPLTPYTGCVAALIEFVECLALALLSFLHSMLAVSLGQRMSSLISLTRRYHREEAIFCCLVVCKSF